LGGINIHDQNDFAFRFSCEHGYLEIAKWLYSLSFVETQTLGLNQFQPYSLGEINIHAEDEEAFIQSCEYGHIEVAKWLYDLGGINIRARDDFAFKWSCNYGYIEIAKWLCSICPNYQIKITDDGIEPIIST
jgi:hypothetical protein